MRHECDWFGCCGEFHDSVHAQIFARGLTHLFVRPAFARGNNYSQSVLSYQPSLLTPFQTSFLIKFFSSLTILETLTLGNTYASQELTCLHLSIARQQMMYFCARASPDRFGTDHACLSLLLLDCLRSAIAMDYMSSRMLFKFLLCGHSACCSQERWREGGWKRLPTNVQRYCHVFHGHSLSLRLRFK